jgi:hypothetical protein
MIVSIDIDRSDIKPPGLWDVDVWFNGTFLRRCQEANDATGEALVIDESGKRQLLRGDVVIWHWSENRTSVIYRTPDRVPDDNVPIG